MKSRCSKCKFSLKDEKGWTCIARLPEISDIFCLFKHALLYLNGIQSLFKQIEKNQREATQEWREKMDKPPEGDEWKGKQ